MPTDFLGEESPGRRWELGGEFHLEGLPDSAFFPWPNEVRWYMLGRHAVCALLQQGSKSRPRLWLPSYFCSEVADGCRDYCELYEYVDDPRRPEPDWASLRCQAGDFVLAVNYFGVRDGTYWAQWRDRTGTVLIEDHTHDPFSNWCAHSQADYAFASLRKTLPIPDGAVLWSPLGLSLPTVPLQSQAGWPGSACKLAAMVCKSEYLEGRGTDDLKIEFRDLQARGEEAMRRSMVLPISAYSHAYLAKGAPEIWRQRRLRNALRLLDRLQGISKAKLLFRTWPQGAVPFVLALIFESTSHRNRCQMELQGKNIYCPVHWICKNKEPAAIDLSARILSLPIDHRYCERDMDFISEILAEKVETRTKVVK